MSLSQAPSRADHARCPSPIKPAELRTIREREHFVGRNDLVFCRPDGRSLDRGAVRVRFVRAQKKAGMRVRRFHDLRHTFGSLAIQQFDVVAVKDGALTADDH